ncbi:hypothetical protein O3G_MSEX001258 [Manduca sexta]|uniref:RRM domain-containing protein n=1 Tax=Manduca sexta TaxID=7130 RepID=A0A921YJC8_MANSE|nr:hypothetical protein O3G_MSEX001258 [Manduca sexta]
MCESLPKEFEKTTEVLPFTKYGLSSLEEFRKAEKDVQRLEWLKKAGLTADEVKLYLDNEAGNLDEGKKIESQVLERKLNAIYRKVAKLEAENRESLEDKEPTTSREENIESSQKNSPAYPKGHPINRIKDLEHSLFGHLKSNIPPITKRRKILRRLERRKNRIESGPKQTSPIPNQSTTSRPGSLWDLQEAPPKVPIRPRGPRDKFIGPKKKTMYTIKNNCIVRVPEEETSRSDPEQELDVVLPETESGEPLLEGTKMSLDDIKKMEKYKDYEPGVPSKVVHLTNIASTVTPAQLSLLFQQYVCDNGGPPDIRLLSGKQRGEAYVRFENYDLAISAVHEINGTIVNGYPIVAKFASSTTN